MKMFEYMARSAGLLFLAILLPGERDAHAEWLDVMPHHVWEFPGDHWANEDYRVEWWYFTGFLERDSESGEDESSNGRMPAYAYQFTFFRIGLATDSLPGASHWRSRNLIMGHASLIDLARSEHRFSEAIYRDAPLLTHVGRYPDSVLVRSRAPAGTDGVWTLSWNGAGFDVAMTDDAGEIAFALRTTPARALVFQGPAGYSVKGPTNASLYYSFPRLDTEGTLTWSGRSIPVRGTSWMDRELSSGHLSEGQTGWDWFSLRMNDGTDMMLYALRDSAGAPGHKAGTWIEGDAPPRYLGDAWTANVKRTWKSGASGIEYPVAWEIRVPDRGLVLEVEALFPEQENRTRIPGGINYWEGAVRVRDESGKERGIGFVEMTGYGEGNRPPL
ncbi:MAG: carotenoid 1,2-hydratase [Gemmatimonadetes bacterium]|nr:carotenoid 1,2-hydratase [Gemmatimonadota bacterium]